jgi:hypothetical protein
MFICVAVCVAVALPDETQELGPVAPQAPVEQGTGRLPAKAIPINDVAAGMSVRRRATHERAWEPPVAGAPRKRGYWVIQRCITCVPTIVMYHSSWIKNRI